MPHGLQIMQMSWMNVLCMKYTKIACIMVLSLTIATRQKNDQVMVQYTKISIL